MYKWTNDIRRWTNDQKEWTNELSRDTMTVLFSHPLFLIINLCDSFDSLDLLPKKGINKFKKSLDKL